MYLALDFAAMKEVASERNGRMAEALGTGRRAV